MIRPPEMQIDLPVTIHNGVTSTTSKVWDILKASHDGDPERVRRFVNECPELAYAQYNYTPPVHFAVREGHADLVRYLLDIGALDPTYITYPFKDTLLTVAQDRDYHEIAALLRDYLNDPARCRYRGDNGEIHYNRPALKKEFEDAVDKEDLDKTRQLLETHPDIIHDETYFWGEGILMMPAKDGNIPLLELLMRYGARVPALSKWARFYYFKHYPVAQFLMENGMDANHMTWHRVTLLHDMAQEGDLQKAALLLKHGAEINPLDKEYLSTPLGLAAKWGRQEMVEWLLHQNADPEKAGAPWATPLAWARKKGHSAIEQMLKGSGARN